MINTNKLKGAMYAAGYPNIDEASKAIGMHPQTMYRKLKKGIFDSDEILLMIETYDITDPEEIFFVRQ